MYRETEFRFGLAIVTVLVAANGISALLVALGISPPPASTAERVLALISGLALLHRAFALRQRGRRSYLITVGLLTFRVVLAIARAISAPTDFSPGVELILALAGLIYLIQPDVRRLFVS